MNCGDWEVRIAAEFDGKLSPEALQHLAACSECAALLTGLERDRGALAAAPGDVAETDYLALRRGLRAAIVERELVRRLARRYFPALLAAAAAVVFGLVLPHSGSRHQISTLPPAVAPVPAVAAQISPKAAVAPHKLANRQPPRQETPSIDLALWEKVTGQGWPPDAGSESPVEMRIETANPNVTIILLTAKEGSDE